MFQTGSIARSPQESPSESAEYRALLESGLFDPDWYLQTYSDVAAARIDPLTHYLLYGGRESRFPNPLFDGGYYLRTYADVAASGMNPLLHYVRFGTAEGRWPNELFDTGWYRLRYPDVAASAINPLAHYLHHGGAEGRDPSQNFSGRWYARAYPHYRETARTPLAHFLHAGRAAGLLALDPNSAEQKAYTSFLRREELAQADDIGEVLRHIQTMTIRPMFVIATDAAGGDPGRDSILGLSQQLYRDLVVLGPSRISDTASNIADTAAGTFIVFTYPGDRLHPRALYAMAAALNADPDLDCIYVDEDQFSDTARSMPRLKPDWSPDHLESSNYIGYGAAFRASLAREYLENATSYYDFVLRFTEQRQSIAHVREVLYHRAESNALRSNAVQASEIAALESRLERTGRLGTVEALADVPSCYEVRTAMTSTPLVTIIIPTAGKTVFLKERQQRIDLLVNCLNSLMRLTTYTRIELVVVAAAELNSEQHQAIEASGALVVTDAATAVNVAAKYNLGAESANGEFLIFLNDDVEPVAPDWIERLLEHFSKPHVGVAGGKLLYADGTVQHAGFALARNMPESVLQSTDDEDPGYFGSSVAARNYSSVSAACLMTRSVVFRAAGGFTTALALSCNDVDYCLKVGDMGLYTVYVPGAKLFHFGAQSRASESDGRDLELFATRWARLAGADPFYNEDRLTVAPATFTFCGPA